MKKKIPYKETTYGFDWGSAMIERTASLDDGSVVVCIETPRQVMFVRITKTGFIRTSITPAQKIK